MEIGRYWEQRNIHGRGDATGGDATLLLCESSRNSAQQTALVGNSFSSFDTVLRLKCLVQDRIRLQSRIKEGKRLSVTLTVI